MFKFKSFKDNIFNINEDNFESHATELFKFQYVNNPVYREYVKSLHKDPDQVKSLEDIPFLPIDFFKNHSIKSGSWNPANIFESSGTVNQITSKHYIEDTEFYLKVAERIFTLLYGSLDQYHILALLPSYLERKNASLVAMIEHFIRKSNSSFSGFYLHNHQDLINNLNLLNKSKEKIFLIGVTFGLLDLAEAYELDLKNHIIMETGGMKGRREEMIRKEVHDILKSRFNVDAIHSEYGMTELLSQAYSLREGKFQTPPWMKVLIRDLNDPFQYMEKNRNGGINVIDLANIHSCAFIETSDIGVAASDGSFEVLGRFDQSDIRGCNLMVF